MSPDFFSRWSFFTQPDPTHGAVFYYDQNTATAQGMITATADRIYMGADMISAGISRGSVRIESKEAFNAGLFVITLDHMPSGCGMWPAFWMFGHDDTHDWPVWGEFDIIEGVHRATKVSTTLHTGPGCDMSQLVAGSDFSGGWNSVNEGGSKAATNCWVEAPGQFFDQGCSQHGAEGSFGPDFNANGGGTFAAEWDPLGLRIRTWFWPRGQEPPDLGARRPVPDSWGAPYSFFSLGWQDCPTSHFINMHMVFDLTFCGDLGNAYFKDSCPIIAQQMSCDDYVKNHPEAMTEGYWSIRAFDTYQPAIMPPVLYRPRSNWFTVFLALLTPMALLAIVSLWGIQRMHDPSAEFSVESARLAVLDAVEQWKSGGIQAYCSKAAEFVGTTCSQAVQGCSQAVQRLTSSADRNWEALPANGHEARVDRGLARPTVKAGTLELSPGDPVVVGPAFRSGQIQLGTQGVIESVNESDSSANVRFEGRPGAIRVPKEQLANLEPMPRGALLEGVHSSLALLRESAAKGRQAFMELHPHWQLLLGGLAGVLCLGLLLVVARHL
mmetsp:Transcript_84535/g.217769  ORF Transcript_84535/g.217769 Transcript_84535/m.217769 type:complete len:553 (+) Transcript_84535:87-1745(+)